MNLVKTVNMAGKGLNMFNQSYLPLDNIYKPYLTQKKLFNPPYLKKLEHDRRRRMLRTAY